MSEHDAKCAKQVADLQIEIERMSDALREIQRFNPICIDDRETYIAEVIEWALGRSKTRPVPEECGL